MGILIMMKEGGSLGIDTISVRGKPISEDIDLLASASGATLSLAFRVINEAVSVTNSTSSQARAIVIGA
tara:strand:- start:1252 stop:1458 length:207 start_codon:yes stop_codon:yes gene_type:complete